jgi:hypothetical protein
MAQTVTPEIGPEARAVVAAEVLYPRTQAPAVKAAFPVAAVVVVVGLERLTPAPVVMAVTVMSEW